MLDLFAELGIKPQQTDGGDIAVFDPCSMRHYEGSRETVRNLAQEAGFSLEELEYHGQYAQCCSFGGHMDIANPPYKDWLVKERVSASPLPYLVYCSNCRDIFAAEGKPVLHALELFQGCGRQESIAPTLEQRLLNRAKVKEELIMTYFPDQKGELPPPQNQLPLNLGPELAAKLEQERILLEDVAAVINACETSRRRLRKPNGHYVGHLQRGYTTYWVEYLPENGSYTLINAYSHRMKIEGEEAGHAFHTELPRCPVCGQVYIDESLVKGRMAQVEMELEDK